MARRAPIRAALRDLYEQVAATATGSPLKVDEEAGVIFGVKVLGRFSRNSHGLTEAENGTEYTRGCMESALPLYEGAKVKKNHPPDRAKPGAERDTDDTFGILRNVRLEDEAGDPCVRADLHYLKTHPMAGRVVEDVKRGLGVYGLSHNASAAKESLDRAAKRLRIESLAGVRSVDLVDKPATNRNLWESQEPPTVKITVRSLLESRLAKLSKPRRAWADRLLEDDLAGPMAAEMDAPAADADPAEALWQGVRAAILAILDGDGTADDKAAKVKEYLRAHEKMTGPDEPAEPTESEGDDDEKDKEAMESLRTENARLKAEAKVRELCEAESFLPTKTQLKALALLESEAERRELVGAFKTAGTRPPLKTPKSTPPGGTPGPTKDKSRDITESEYDAAEDLAAIRGAR